MEAEKLQIPTDNVTEPSKRAKLQMDDYAARYEIAAQQANSARTKVEDAQGATNRSMVKIEQVLKKLQELLAKLDNISRIDWDQLERLEDVLRNASAQGDKAFSHVSDLEETQEVIKKSIVTYQLDLRELKKQIALANVLYESMPSVCLRLPPCPENSCLPTCRCE